MAYHHAFSTRTFPFFFFFFFFLMYYNYKFRRKKITNNWNHVIGKASFQGFLELSVLPGFTYLILRLPSPFCRYAWLLKNMASKKRLHGLRWRMITSIWGRLKIACRGNCWWCMEDFSNLFRMWRGTGLCLVAIILSWERREEGVGEAERIRGKLVKTGWER